MKPSPTGSSPATAGRVLPPSLSRRRDHRWPAVSASRRWVHTPATPQIVKKPGLSDSRVIPQPPQQQRLGSLRRSSMPPAASASASAGNVNGEWTHDLHDSLNRGGGGSSLMSRTTVPGSRKPAKRQARLAAALDRMDLDGPHGGQATTQQRQQQQVNVIKPAAAASPAGLTIRGIAGPFAIMAQNFAPGTSAADIESAMTPIGGEMVSCRFVKTQPIIIVEMVFVSREGGERVIETFNDKTVSCISMSLSFHIRQADSLQADGRLIKVYPKPGGYQPSKTAPTNAPSGPRASQSRRGNASDQVVDGSMGFPETRGRGDVVSASQNTSGGDRALYSDKIVSGSRRGRGGQRGRGGR